MMRGEKQPTCLPLHLYPQVSFLPGAFAPGDHSLEILTFASTGFWENSSSSHGAHYGKFSSIKAPAHMLGRVLGSGIKEHTGYCLRSEDVQSRYRDSK